MPRKKILPDHSFRAVDIKAPFSEVFAKKMEAEFNIPEYFRLADRLNNAAYWYQWVLVSSPSKLVEQRQLLEAVHQQASELDGLLCKLGTVETKMIRDAIPDFSQFSLKDAIPIILALKHIAGYALDGIPSKLGRREDVAFREIVSRLHELYRQGTGDNRKITFNAYGARHTGPAFEFICKCLPILDVHKSEGAIATVIKGAVKSQGN